ncbi:MAG: sensor histidine kinase [Pelobium sp.]
MMLRKIFFVLLFIVPFLLKGQSKNELILLEKAKNEISAKNYPQARKFLEGIDSNSFKPNQLEKGFYYQQFARLAYYDTYEDAKAVNYYYKALKIYEINNSNEDLGIAYSNIVGILTDLKRYKEAEVAIKKSLPYVKNDKIRYGNALVNYSRLMEAIGNYPKAVSLSLDALKLYEESGDQAKIGSGNFQTGLVLETSKQFDKAIEYYNTALSIRKAIKDSLGMSNVYNNLGIIYKNQKKFDLAINSYQNAYSLAIQMGRPVLSINPLINLGVVLNKQNKNEKAIEKYEQALVIANKFNKENAINTIETNLVLLYLNTDQFEKALPLAQKAYNYGEKEGTLEEKMVFNYNLAETLDGLNRSKEAFPYMQTAMKLKDSLNNTQSTGAIAEMLTRFETEKKEQRIKLLGKENNLQKLSIENQELSLSQRALEIDNRDFSINLKNKEIESQKLKSFQQLQQLKLFANEKEIKDLELRQKNIYLFIAALILVGLGFFGFQFYKRRQLNERNRMQEEKIRISRELHDNIGAQLSFINGSIQNMVSQDLQNEELQQTQKITQNTIKELRSTVWLINQQEFSLEEFVVKLREYLKPYYGGKPQINIVNNSDQDYILAPIIATNLFRIVQEAVNNALKYAEAESINVSLLAKENNMKVSIEDDGKGYDINAKSTGYGLKNMQARVNTINGIYKVESKINNGTLINLSVPLS